MSPLSPETNAVLEEVRSKGAPSSADRERLRSMLAARLGASALDSPPPSALAGAAGAAGQGASAGLRGFRAKVLVGVAAAIGAGALAHAVSSPSAPSNGQGESAAMVARSPAVVPLSPPTPPSRPAPIEAPAEEVPTRTTAPLVRTPGAAIARRPPPKPKAPVATAASPIDERPPAKADEKAPAADEEKSPSNVAEELRILTRAQSALNRGDPAAALAALDEHARRFPKGVLTEERSSQRIVALCAAGRRSDAQAAAAQFMSEHPDSPLSARVRNACRAPDARP